jgi:hypothetical protein
VQRLSCQLQRLSCQRQLQAAPSPPSAAPARRHSRPSPSPHTPPCSPAPRAGDRSGGWAVEPPAEEIPAELPEPCLGINFARDGMTRRDWLSLVAVHSDAWLMAVAFFYAVKLDASGRARLYRQLNTLPTLFEVVTGRARPAPPPAKPGWQQARKDAGGASAVAGTLPPRLPPLPFKEMPASAIQGGSKHPDPRGRRLQFEDITPRLQGKYTELYWPDDALWYLVYIDRIDVRAKTAK